MFQREINTTCLQQELRWDLVRLLQMCAKDAVAGFDGTT